MSRASRTIRTAVLTTGAAIILAGCGGGDAAVPATGTPTPAPDPNAATVGADPNAAAGATDPVTGAPLAPAAATQPGATVPELDGDDTSSGSGFGAVDSSPVFSAQAASGDALKDSSQSALTTTVPTSTSFPGLGGGTSTTSPPQPTTPTETAPPEPAAAYSGARIYVDGMVHVVQKNGTFPKGNPVFRLVSVSAATVELDLVAGEFTAGGGQGTVLDKGHLYSLVNASEQVTYKLKYLKPVVSESGVQF